MKNLKIIISCISIAALLILVILFHKPLIRPFKSTHTLDINPQDIEYISIINSNGYYLPDMSDDEAIKELTNFLNSIKLIEEEPYEEYEYNSDNDYINVYLYGNIPPTAITFKGNGYLHFSDEECWDCCGTDYYIKNQSYAEISDFLNEFTEKYYNNK